MSRIRIGEMLVQLGRIDSVQLKAALAHQRQWGGRLGGTLVHLGFVGELAFLEALGQQLGVPFVVIGDREIPPKVLALVPRKLAQARRVLPLQVRAEGRRGQLVVALGDPADLGIIDELGFVTGLAVQPVLAGEADLDQALERHMGIPPRPHAPSGFGARTDAVELPPEPGSRGGWRRGLH